MTDGKLPLIYKKVEESCRTYEVRDAEGKLFMWDEWYENIAPGTEMAAYIVNATNSYQSLIDALEGAKRELYNARLVLNKIDKTPTWIKGIDKSIEKIEAALLAARG